MDELRLKKIENRLDHHEGLHADNDARHKANAELMSVMKKTVDSHDKMITLAEKAIELLEQLIKYLSWVGVMAKWISTIAVAFAATWHALKWAMAKMGLLW